VFDHYNSEGLFWAMDQAMEFWRHPSDVREKEISRIMSESLKRFNHEACAQQYIELYEKMLNRPLVKRFG
jgi:glycogen synthase